jgi:hypothetical protein
MKTTRYVLAVALGLIGLVAPTATRANSIVQVTISNLTFNGNSVCGPTGTALCTQTLSESWQWDNTTNTYVSGSFSSSTAGALGTSFSLFGQIPFPFVGSFQGAAPLLAGIQDSNGDVLTVFLPTPPLVTGTYTPSTINSFQLLPGTYFAALNCASYSTTCQALFPTSGGLAVLSTGGTVTVTTVSEPPTGALLGAGLFGLMGIVLLRKRLA